jgi:hypothetical protein
MKTYREFIKENKYENPHLVEVIPKRFVYHTSSPFLRDKISKEGLKPQGRSAAWLTTTNIKGKVIFAVNSEDKNDVWDSTYNDDIYKIDIQGLDNKWYYDPNFNIPSKYCITFQNIPKENIKLIYKGTGESW